MSFVSLLISLDKSLTWIMVGYTAAVLGMRLFTFETVSVMEMAATVGSVVAIAMYSREWMSSGIISLITVAGIHLAAVYIVWKVHVSGPEPAKHDLTGKVCIVTGSNSGIGVETARNIADMGAEVVLACRTMSTAEATKKDIIATTGNKKVSVMKLDLGDFDSVREFAAAVQKKYKSIDILVHNAGLMSPERNESKQGFEMMMQTNYLSMYLLTLLLLPTVKKSNYARIVLVSSTMCNYTCFAHGGFDFDDMFCKQSFNMFKAYGQSKLAMELFKFELHKRLRESGSHVVVNTLMPGSIRTSISQNWHWVLAQGHRLIAPLLKTTVSGAYTTTYVATEPSISGASGLFFENSRIVDQPVQTRCDEDASKLWKLAASLTKIDPELLSI